MVMNTHGDLKRIIILVLIIVLKSPVFGGPDNIAPLAKISASSCLSDEYIAVNVMDDEINHPWIEMQWNESRAINRMMLFECPGLKSPLSNQSIMDQAYFSGRSYYVLRSGNVKMILQAEKVNVLPALTYLLYDAENIGQTKLKKQAINYSEDGGYLSSALKVKTLDTWFTAMGHHTNTRWVLQDGIPSVEAKWWAGGLRISEVIAPITNQGVFKRSITIHSKNLAGEDSVSFSLSLPGKSTFVGNNFIFYEHEKDFIAIAIKDNSLVSFSEIEGTMRAGPFNIKQDEEIKFETFLIVNTAIDKSKDAFLDFVRNTINNCQPEALAQAVRWKNSSTITTSDSLIQKVYDASRYILPGCISEEGRMDAGIFEYGGQWVRDASLTTLGLIHCGEFELARASLKNMLENMIKEEGNTMIGSVFDAPDREQFDQMGEFMHCMKSYVDWSGDNSLLAEYREKIIKMIERPLNPIFRDETGMVHNRREFWERTFNDAYELAYQTWVIQGLNDAADLSELLNVHSKEQQWREEASIIKEAMLNHTSMKLVVDGHFIKRRNVTGEEANIVEIDGYFPATPAWEEKKSSLMPDATLALPISLGIVDAKSDLSLKTLNLLEKLKNQRWTMGGYDRYHTSSQLDQPGPWSFASTFIMRAQHEAGLFDQSRNTLEWLYHKCGGKTGAYWEAIPLTRRQEYHTGFLPWTSGEIIYFVIHHMMGIKFERDSMTIKPALYKNTAPFKADLRYKNGRINFEFKGSTTKNYALVNGIKILPEQTGVYKIPADFVGGDITIFTKE